MGPETKFGRQSFFDGGLLSLIGWSILGFIVTVFSAGILYPWALVMVYGWKINHTVIDGHRMQFNGSAVGLFGNWIKWLLLMIITLGIYGFWVGIKLEDWKAKNTRFVNQSLVSQERKSLSYDACVCEMQFGHTTYCNQSVLSREMIIRFAILFRETY